MNHLTKIFLGVVLAASLVPGASAQLCPGAGRAGIEGVTSCDFCTVQDAIDLAPSGSTVLVKPGGILNVPPLTIDHDIDISVGDANCNVEDPNGFAGFTTLGNTRILTVENGGDVELRYLELVLGAAMASEGGLVRILDPGSSLTVVDALLQLGSAQKGGCVYVDQYAGLFLKGSTTVLDCDATLGGGAIFVEGGQLLVADSTTISGGVTPGEGGNIHVATHAGFVELDDTATITQGEAFNGGGLAATEGAKILMYADSVLEFNVAANGGGGVYLHTGSELEMDSNSQIRDNEVRGIRPAIGGGVVIDQDASLTMLASSEVAGNHGPEQGGGIAVVDATASLTLLDQARVYSNRANQRGGGIFAEAGAEVEIAGSAWDWVAYTSLDTVGGVRIEDNLVDCSGSGICGGGGVFAVDDGTTITASSVVLHNNWASTAGIGVDPFQLNLETVQARPEDAARSRGGGLTVESGAVASLEDSVVTRNFAGQGGGVAASTITGAGQASELTVTSTAACVPQEVIGGPWENHYCSEISGNRAMGWTDVGAAGSVPLGGEGGAVFARGDVDVEIIETGVQNNTASYTAPGLVLREVGPLGGTGQALVSSSLFAGNAFQAEPGDSVTTSFTSWSVGTIASGMASMDLQLEYNSFVDNDLGVEYGDNTSGRFDGNIVWPADGLITSKTGLKATFPWTQIPGICNMGVLDTGSPASLLPAPTNDGAPASHPGLVCDPFFVSEPGRGDFRVEPGVGTGPGFQCLREAVDACTTGVAVDLDGECRPDGVCGGSGDYDRGAFEYVP